MKLNEIYTINRALDGKSIYSLPKVDKMGMSKVKIIHIKQNLIKQGILESENTFTKKGIFIAKMLLDYKKAKKYVFCLDNMMGIIDKNTAVVMSRKEEDDFQFNYINPSIFYKEIMSVYSFMPNVYANDSKIYESIPIEMTNVFENYHININNAIKIISHELDENNVTCELYFFSEGNYYIFDYTQSVLHNFGFNYFKNMIKERMAV